MVIKMNKKAFTLVELLAVIVILGVVSLIAIPAVMNRIKASEESAYEQNKEVLLAAGKLYFVNQSIFLEEIGDSITITLSQLINAKEIERIKSPFNSTLYCNETGSFVHIEKVANAYTSVGFAIEYSVTLECPRN